MMLVEVSVGAATMWWYTTAWTFLKNLKTELAFDSTVLLLDIYQNKMKALIWKDTCTPGFILVLIIIAKIWKQTKFYGMLLSHKNETLPFETMWMDLESIMLNEISHAEKNKTLLLVLSGI